MCKARAAASAPTARVSLLTPIDVFLFFCFLLARSPVLPTDLRDRARTRLYTSELRAHSYFLFRPLPAPPVYDKAGVPGPFDVTYGRPARVQRQPHSAAPMLSGAGLRTPGGAGSNPC